METVDLSISFNPTITAFLDPFKISTGKYGEFYHLMGEIPA